MQVSHEPNHQREDNKNMVYQFKVANQDLKQHQMMQSQVRQHF